MNKNFLHATLSLFVLIFFTTSIHAQWIQTNWTTSTSFFNLYTNQDRVFARTWDSLNGGRVFLTSDNGANWTQISSADSTIDILSIILLNNNILAGTWNGFYRSTLGAISWNAVIPAGIPADTAIWAIAMITTTLFAGTVGDMYKSSDSGSTWTEVKSGIPVNACINSIVENGSAIFAGSDSNGVFRSTNGGISWTAINSGLTDLHVFQLATMGSKLFAVTLKGVFVSNNNGTSWTANSSSLKNINCFLAVQNQLFAGTDSSAVYLSSDSGATWTSFGTGMPVGTRVWSLAANSNSIFAGTNSGVWRTPINPADTGHFIITAGASEGGTISPQGDITVYKYGSQTFWIAPATGYRINEVLVDGASAGAVASYTFLNVTANHTISAVFTALPTYTIEASAGGGGTISPSGTVTVYEGSSQKFTITPLTGYAVSSVIVDGSSVGAVSTYTFTNVSGNHTIAAFFVSAPYTITASAGSNGSISPSGAVTVPAGSSQTFVITPSSGYEIAGVLVDGASAGAVYSYTFSSVTANHTISASFSSLTKYQINCGGGASSPFAADQYFSGGSTYSGTSAITTTGVTNPAPQAVYQTERYGAMTYTIPSLTTGAQYTARLHFAELYFNATGKRKFNVAINGTSVLSNFDVYATAGGQYKALVREFTATANASGQIVIAFTNVTDNAKIDGIEIIKIVTVANTPPTIATAASASPSPVAGSTTALSVLGADDNGEPDLTYTWATTGTPPAPVTFSANGTNGAKNATATFSKAGSYTFQVTIKDQGNLTVTSSVTATVNQTLTSIVLSPTSATVNTSATQQFTATGRDQFAANLSVQPSFTWSVSGGGTISASGLFTAGTTVGGPYTVTAQSGTVSGTASVTVSSPLTKYEAENATLSGGAKKNTNHTGYSGTGFVDGYYNSTTAQTSFTVNVSTAGSYTVKLHYSAGNGASTNTGLYINGTKIKNISCPVTANWNTWADESETLTLNAGNNTIAYKAVTSSASCINLDYVAVSK